MPLKTSLCKCNVIMDRNCDLDERDFSKLWQMFTKLYWSRSTCAGTESIRYLISEAKVKDRELMNTIRHIYQLN